MSPDHVKVLTNVEDGRRIQVGHGPLDGGLDTDDRLLQLPVLGVPILNRILAPEPGPKRLNIFGV
jgi:hypothetical protein